LAEILGSHRLITPLDLMLAAAATLAMIVAIVLDRMRGQPRDVMSYLVVWVRYFFGIHMFMSGANYFIQWSPQMVMDHPLAGPFQHSMTAMGLFAVVKAVETLVSLCLIFNVFVPPALLIEMPISVVIFYLSFFVVADPRTLWTGPRELLMNLFLLAAYGGYFLPILKPFVPQRPLWALKRGAP
jgi:riboflavin transporter